MLFNTLIQAAPTLMQTDAAVQFAPLLRGLFESFGKFDTATYVSVRPPPPALAAVPPDGPPPNVRQLLPQGGGAGLGA